MTIEHIFRAGYKPSPKHLLGDVEPEGLKKFRAARCVEAPPSYDLTQFVIEIFDQGGEGSCVPTSGAGCIRLSDVQQLALQAASEHGVTVQQAVSIIKQSPPQRACIQLAYYMCRCEDGDPYLDEGTYCSTFWYVGDTYGFAHESVWPYVAGDTLPMRKRVPMLTREALRHKTSGFRKSRLTSTGDARIADIKAAISAGYPIHFGGPVDTPYMRLRNGQRWPGCGSDVRGGHARYWAKYDEQGPWEVGSYGTGFATGGLVPCTWDAVHQCDDLWIVERMPII